MANTKKPTSSKPVTSAAFLAADSLESHLADQLGKAVEPGQTLLLGLSGGVDSVVLLNLLLSVKASLGFNLTAMHVHHGLSPNADRWATFCASLCQASGVPLQIVHVDVPLKPASGIEAEARAARYRTLFATEADLVVVAHHLNDQAETLLLQLFRGSGVKGLASMPREDTKRRLLRPLLDVERSQIEAYAKLNGLQWIEDESNTDGRYGRNYLRHQLLPAIEQRFPGATAAIARSASHMAEAAGLLDELAAIDAQSCLSQGQLKVSGLHGLSEARARNLLRWWLAGQDMVLPSARRLQEMFQQLLHARQDAQVKLSTGQPGIYLRRFQDVVYLDSEAPTLPFAMLWNGEDMLHLPDGSILRFERGTSAGLAYQRLGIDRLRIALRSGGERFKPEADRPSRTLKHLLQEANVPPWQRQRLPLIYHEDRLAVVPGIGTCAELQARQGEPSLRITWQPSA